MGETRNPIELAEAQVGLIYRGHYYLIPVCIPGTTTPPDMAPIGLAAAAAQLVACCPSFIKRAGRHQTRRLARTAPEVGVASQPRIGQAAPGPCGAEFESVSVVRSGFAAPATLFRIAPGRAWHRQPYALTLLDTGPTMVFDQSHIFFDGACAALAEILTQEALYWATHLGATHFHAADSAPAPATFNVQPPT
ncbi:MAG: hypothetical protein U0401_01165 [Anaerolineae bacterium]